MLYGGGDNPGSVYREGKETETLRYSYDLGLSDWVTVETDESRPVKKPGPNSTVIVTYPYTKEVTNYAKDSTIDLSPDRWGNLVVYVNGEEDVVVMPKPYAIDATGKRFDLEFGLDKKAKTITVSGDLSGSVPAKETITVYSSKKPEYYGNWADSLAKNLGMSGKTSETAETFYAEGADAEDYYFVVQKDAPVISFQKFDARSGFPQSRDESVSAANAFLTENGLMSSEALEPGVTYNSGESISKSGERTTDWRTSVITYSRELDGLPVWNSLKMVELDSRGNVIGYFQNWRDYEPYKELRLKSLEKAFAEFQVKQDLHDKGSADKIVVNRVQLGYYSQPAVATEKILQPIYVFEGYLQYGDSIEPFIPISISATDEVFDEIH